MNINTNQIVSMTEANQNFSKVVKIADKNGSAVVFKNNKHFCLQNSLTTKRFNHIIANVKRSWRNRQTRTFEGRMVTPSD